MKDCFIKTYMHIHKTWLTWLSSLSPRGEWGHERVLSIFICLALVWLLLPMCWILAVSFLFLPFSSMFPSVYLFFFFHQGPSQVLSWRSCCYPFWGHVLSMLYPCHIHVLFIAIFFSLQWYWNDMDIMNIRDYVILNLDTN